ncbi:MAG: hypothetical protein WBB46_10840 [Candidatus Deferrimicrobiaceae bacterium]
MPTSVADPSYKPVSDFFEIRHVYMEIVKVSLLPAEETGFDGEDMEGEMREDDRDDTHLWPKEKPGFVTLIPSSPTIIDLVKLEKGKQLGRILNHFDHIPAGTYDKIRVYYRKVKVVLADDIPVCFHPTAHSHFDIHFVHGKNLVIPETTDTTYPDSWIRFFKVKLDVVGLKIKVVVQGKSWKHPKVILRPQIFAEYMPPILYSVAGAAVDLGGANTDARGEFDIAAVDMFVHTMYDETSLWSYNDNVLAHSRWEVAPVDNAITSGAMRNGAIVEVLGRFAIGTTDDFQAKHISITFPDVLSGEVDNGWSLDNTFFVLRSSLDNVVPQPDRFNAYYDNLDLPHVELDYTDIDNNVSVKARGYLVPSEEAPDTRRIEAYWISIRP